MQMTQKTRSSPMARGQSLQDPFLNALRKERVPVSIYLVNGIKLQGQIDSFDQFVVCSEQRESDGLQTRHFDGRSGAQRAFADRRGRRSDGTGHRRVSPLAMCRSDGAICSCLNARGVANAPYWSASGIGHPVDPTIRRNSRRWRHPRARSAVGMVSAARPRPDPKYFVGSGKAEEIRDVRRASTMPTLDTGRSDLEPEPGAQSRKTHQSSSIRS